MFNNLSALFKSLQIKDDKTEGVSSNPNSERNHESYHFAQGLYNGLNLGGLENYANNENHQGSESYGNM